jgi:GNAT superfamily N-acetyltransferase
VTDYEITRYRPELRPGLLALRRHLFPGDDERRNESYFQWKHEENPYSDGPIAYVALSGGEVVGARAFQGARWRLGDAGATADWLIACDLIVHPAHRGKGLYHLLMRHALAELAAGGHGCTLNWSANPVNYGASLRSGWRLVLPYTTWWLEAPGVRRARRLHDRLAGSPVAWRLGLAVHRLAIHRGFAALDAAWSRLPPAEPLRLERDPRPDTMGELVDAGGSPLIHHVRDATYYRWRFRNPRSEYRFVYWHESRLEGFVVLQVARGARSADLRIVDWEASRPDILEGMLLRLVRAGGYDGLTIWSATLPEAVRGLLSRLGFSSRDESLGNPDYRPGLMAVGPGGSDLQLADAVDARLLRDPARWGLRMAYSDAY